MDMLASFTVSMLGLVYPIITRKISTPKYPFGNWNKFHCTHLSQEVALQINTDFYSMEINDITYKIRGAIFAVYNALGPGLLESVYELALMHELSKQGLKVDCATPLGSGE